MPEIAALVTALILERPLCMNCLVTRADTGEAAVERALSRIARAMTVQRTIDRCRTCGTHGPVIVAGRPEPRVM
jgi:hypothetical protein